MTSDHPPTSQPLPGQPLLPDTYCDGDFDAWERHFAACAAANSWTDERKLLVLPTRLRGRAQRIYDHLSPAEKDSYTSLRDSMSAKCSSTAMRILAAANFRSRSRLACESLDTYAYDLCDAYDKAYPHSSPEMRDSMVRDQFVLGLEFSVRDKVTAANPSTLGEALQTAARVEAIRQLPHPLPPAVAVTHTGEDVRRSGSSQPVDPVAALTLAVAELGRKVDDLLGQTPGCLRQPVELPRCFRCGSEGHFARTCSRRSRGRSASGYRGRPASGN